MFILELKPKFQVVVKLKTKIHVLNERVLFLICSLINCYFCCFCLCTSLLRFFAKKKAKETATALKITPKIFVLNILWNVLTLKMTVTVYYKNLTVKRDIISPLNKQPQTEASLVHFGMFSRNLSPE